MSELAARPEHEHRARSGTRRTVAAAWLRLSAMQRIGVLVAGIAALAITLFLGVVVHLPALDAPLRLSWPIWVLAFAVGEAPVVRVQVRKDAHAFSLTDLVLAAALCLAHPVVLVTAQVAGAALALLVVRRQTGLKLAFNLAQFALGACVATTVFTVIVHGDGWASPWAWVAALVAIAVTTVTADLCVFGAIGLSDGTATWPQLRQLFAMSIPFTVGTGAVGLLLVRTSVLDPWGLVLLAAPAWLMFAAYRSSAQARRQEDNLRLLHEVTSLLHDGDDVRDGLGNFVTAVREAFRCRVAALLLLDDDGVSTTVTGSREGQEPVVLVPLAETDAFASLLQAMTEEGLAALRSGRKESGPLDEYLAQRGFKDAVVAVLRTDARVHGLMLVADRLDKVTTFTHSDMTLLETFARHVATSLERGRLQSDLRLQSEMQEKLRHQALHDALTGLPNRSLFLDRASTALELARRSGAWPAVVYLDLDGFKPVNDTYGHEAGDRLLQAFAARLHTCLRAADTAARLGGDEFAVLVHGPIDADGAGRVIERIRAELARPVDLGDGREATVGASIGVAMADGDTADVDSLVRRADGAMYEAKRARDGRWVLATGELPAVTA
jgi:diguanylate cyclase (GGDEF)-like protein